MYAIVDVQGFQYKVAEGETLRVPKLSAEAGATVSFDKVLMVADGDKFTVGAPLVDGAVVKAKVVDQGKYDKVIVFKKKRRKDYSVKRGHRQDFTQVSIENIALKAKKAASKKAAPEKIEAEASDE